MSTLQSLDPLYFLLGLCGVIFIYRYASIKEKKLPLPPGPKPLPLVGNLLDMPTGNIPEGKHWSRHRALYGPISSVRALGTTLIIINDSHVAFELLDKRSSIYSNRPTFPFSGELVGLSVITTLTPYGDTLRLHRRWMQNYMGSSTTMKHIKDVQEVEARRLLLRTMESPDRFMDHLRTFPGAVILRIAFGYNIERKGHDYLVDFANEANVIFSDSGQPGRWLVDVIPALKYLPEWLPGAGFKRTARKWRSTLQEFYDKPFEFVKRQMATGNSSLSFVEYILENGSVGENDENNLKYAAATLYGAGAETTIIVLATFHLAMTLYPAVLKRAQEEIDRVVGDDRLPSFTDRDNLPYINAIVKETLRWENGSPTGIPHATTEEDTYMGYRIPKGAIIVPNVWQMSHDPETYPDPFTFNPERFLEENGSPVELNPQSLVFGFGRRICPGMELAMNSLFIAIAMSIAVFDITKARDENGMEIEPVHEYQAGLNSHPKPFRCSIMPRSEKAALLIQSVLEEHPFPKGDGDLVKGLRL